MNYNQSIEQEKIDYESKREQRMKEQNQIQRKRALQKSVKKSLWILAAIALVGFIGWWGVRLNQQQAAVVAQSSKKGLAPDFSLPATTGQIITLSDYQGKKNVLIYFNEGLSCQPCWEQIPELEKTLPEFEKMNITLLSVSLDPVDKWPEIIKQYNIKTPVLSYDSARTEADYNLTPFSMGMGRRAGHTFVLVGTDGTIKWRKDYWPSRGHMVAGGTMFVETQEIVRNVKAALEQ